MTTDPTHVSLLDRIIEQSLEPEYRDAARRRAAEGRQPGESSGSGSRRIPFLLGWAVIGALFVVAAQQTEADEPADLATREVLVERLAAERTELDAVSRALAEARAESTRLDGRLTEQTRQLQRASDRAATLGAVSGFAPVSGPGVVYTVESAAEPDAAQRVQDRDLQLLVNGLAVAGAEAIAVNDQRLSSFSAIRNSGAGIRINRVTVNPPYTVEAIGDVRTLAADFVDTDSGAKWQTLVDALGFTVSQDNRSSLRLPAAPDFLLDQCAQCERVEKPAADGP